MDFVKQEIKFFYKMVFNIFIYMLLSNIFQALNIQKLKG